jgi:hypothetical protein
MKKHLSVFFMTLFFAVGLFPYTTALASYQEKYNYEIFQKSDDAVVEAGNPVILWTKLRNTGSYDWNSDYNYPIHFGTAEPRDRSSNFYSYDKWITPNRITLTERNNDIYTFAFTASVPYNQATGTYRECFYPVLENLTWIEKTPICWNIHVQNNSSGYIATPIENNFSYDLKKGEEKQIEFAVRNDGNATWYKYGSYPVHLGTYNPTDRTSDFYSSSWLSYNRPAELNENEVAPGSTGHFSFTIKAPENPSYQYYYESFWPVAEYKSWFSNQYFGESMNFSINITDYDDDDDNTTSFSQKYSDITVDKDFIENNNKDTVEIEAILKDKNDDPIENVWIDLIGKEIDPEDPDEWELINYTIKTNSDGKATYEFTSNVDADYEFTFKYDGDEYDTPVKFSAYDPDDESKDFSDQNSSIIINKDYIEDNGDDEAKITIEIRDYDDDPIKNKSFDLIVRERELGEDNWDEYDYNLSTNSSGIATKYFTTDNESDFEFTFELGGDRFRHWTELTSYEDDADNDFEPDNSSIRVNRTSIKGDNSDYALIEVKIRDNDNDPLEYQKLVLTGERCNLSGNNCRDIDDIKLTTDNSGYAEHKMKYSGEAKFDVTYEVDGEDSDQHVQFEFYEDNDDNDDYDINNQYDVPVLSLSYIPTDNNDDVDVDIMKDWTNKDLDDLRDYIDESNKDLMYYLEEGSTYHGYKDSSADAALDYYLVEEKEFLQELPVSDKFKWDSTGRKMIDYNEILDEDVDICDYVDNDGVKEVWIWTYVPEDNEPVNWESNMMMGNNIEGDWNYSTYGNVSNSYRQKDMPICDNTYTAYTYNFGRNVDMALEDHTHQIEAVLNYVDGRDDTASSNWDDLLFWGKFVGSDSTNKIVRPGCGWTHYPPNTNSEYDWTSTKEVSSDCENWEPDGGDKEIVSCKTWGDSGCDKYEEDGDGVAFKVWWMQNIPGIDNDVYDDNDKIKNWWDFIGDFDGHINDQSLTY